MKQTDLGKKIKERVTDGWLVDDQVVIDAVKSRISHGSESDTSFVLEGFPKNKVQAISL